MSRYLTCDKCGFGFFGHGKAKFCSVECRRARQIEQVMTRERESYQEDPAYYARKQRKVRENRARREGKPAPGTYRSKLRDTATTPRRFGSKSRPGRKPLSPQGSISVTVKFPKQLLRTIDRLGDKLSGSRPRTIRALIEDGIAARKNR